MPKMDRIEGLVDCFPIVSFNVTSKAPVVVVVGNVSINYFVPLNKLPSPFLPPLYVSAQYSLPASSKVFLQIRGLAVRCQPFSSVLCVKV